MVDVLQQVAARFHAEDLERMRSIIILTGSYVDAGKKLVQAEEELKEIAPRLEEAVMGVAQHRYHKDPSREKRLAETLVKYSTCMVNQGIGGFALETDEAGFINLWEFGPQFEVDVEADLPKGRTKWPLTLDTLNPATGKGVLYYSNEDEHLGDDVAFFSFAISVDTRQTADQMVALARCEGEHYAATNAIQEYISQADGRVDA
jgi:hypothetical protein